MIKTIFYISVFVLPVLGYMLMFYKKFALKVEFCPAAVFTGIITLMYIAAILNILNFMQYAIIITGGLFLCYFMFAKPLTKEELKTFLFPSLTLFLIYCIVIAAVYNTAIFTMGDNYSHWGMIVRQMLNKLRLPNYENPMIIFKTYLPGSSLFVYYFAHIFDDKESIMLIAQNILSVSFFTCIFAFVKTNKNKVLLFVPLSLFGIYMLCGASYMNELLVDSLLAQTAFADFAVIWFYRKEPKKALILNVPFMSSLVLLKDSGKIFAIINLILIIFIAVKNRKEIFPTRRDYIKAVILVAIPFILASLWIPHVKMVYGESRVVESTHSINLMRLDDISADKSEDILANTGKTLIKYSLSLKNSGFVCLSGINAALIILCLFSRKTGVNIKSIIMLIMLCDAIYILYNVGLYLLYIYSMTTEEALRLAGYDRYIGTMSIYLSSCVVALMLDDYGKKDTGSVPLSASRSGFKNTFVYLASVLIVALPAYFIIFQNELFYFAARPHLPEDSPSLAMIDTWAQEIPNSYAYSYAVIDCDLQSSQTESRYLICSFKLNSYNTYIVTEVKNQEDFLEQISGYDYVLIYNSNSIVDELLKPFASADSAQGKYFGVASICDYYEK